MNHLERFFSQDNVAVLYIYCDYKDKDNQTDRNLLASLAKQSILQQPGLPQEIKNLHSRCSHGRASLSLKDWVVLLKSSISCFRRSFIIIDALDEYLTSKEKDYDTQISLLCHLYDLQQEMPRKCRMLITSRELDSFPNELYDIKKLEIRATNEDIRAYVTSRIHSTFRFAKSITANPYLAKEIAEGVVKKAQGM